MTYLYRVEAYDAQGKPVQISRDKTLRTTFGAIKNTAKAKGVDLLHIIARDGRTPEDHYYFVALYEETPDGPKFDLFIQSDEDRFYDHLRRSEYIASKN